MITPLRVMINGAKGRMGQTFLQLAASCDAVIAAAVDVGDDLEAVIGDCEVIIDFSHHSATVPLCQLAAKHRKPVVIGTTGHSPEETAALKQLSRSIPLVISGNYSLGVNVLFHLVQEAARLLPESYQTEILELHHQHKKDAPSGTAVNMAERIMEARNLSAEVVRNGRSGITGERTNTEIGMHAVRGGEIVGEHTAFFIGPDDRIEITHRASRRDIFARGAFHAAHWVKAQKPGIYDMRAVLGLTS